jgi:hypothetical protein
MTLPQRMQRTRTVSANESSNSSFSSHGRSGCRYRTLSFASARAANTSLHTLPNDAE